MKIQLYMHKKYYFAIHINFSGINLSIGNMNNSE